MDGDLRLGRIEGNGGDWFELVVRGTGFGTTLDMRGWKIQVSQVTGGARLTDTITLSQDNFWAAVPAGMILTFTEDNLAEGGYDTALNADNRLSSAKYSWSNIWLGDSALIASVSGDSIAGIGTTTSGINISGDDTHFAVLNATNGYEFGPVGEGTWRYPEVNSTSNFYLSIDPSGVIDPTLVQGRISAIPPSTLEKTRQWSPPLACPTLALQASNPFSGLTHLTLRAGHGGLPGKVSSLWQLQITGRMKITA